MPRAIGRPPRVTPPGCVRAHLLAVLLIGLAAAVVFGPVFRAGPAHSVALEPLTGDFAITARADAAYQAWLVARHARTFVTQPHRIFETEHCAPTEKTLVYGIPMLTMGLLGVPAALVTREPVLVYNLSILATVLVGAFAMYALVARWTGTAAAGLVAALFFGFQPLRLAQLGHPSVWDIGWTVLAIFFAERLFARGRWRDAAGLGAAIALQIGASFYPLLAATLLAPPLLVWLLLRHRLRHARPAQLGLVALCALLAGAFVLLPYLGAETDAGSLERTRFHYMRWARIADPGSSWFPGFGVLGLAVASCFAIRRRAAPGTGGDPRLALWLGAIAAAAVAAGPHNRHLVALLTSPGVASHVPNLHAALASVVPGLDAVRGIDRLATGTLLALTLLAGLGAGILIRAAGRHGRAVGAALVAVAAFDVLRLPAAGLERPYAWELVEIRPHDTQIAFFDELARRGNRGPIFELPVPTFVGSTKQILLAGYHRRRTSACFGSYRPAGLATLAELGAALPAPAALAALRAMGFTTLVVDRSRIPDALEAQAELERAALRDPRIVPVHANRAFAAFALHPATDPR